jgi:hypothetical protein
LIDLSYIENKIKLHRGGRMYGVNTD